MPAGSSDNGAAPDSDGKKKALFSDEKQEQVAS